jgi:hypothetical protein
MPPPDPIESCSLKDRILLAVQCLKCDASLSIQHIALLYNVPRTTLARRRAGTQSYCNTYPNLLKLTKSEEDSLIRRIRDLSLRGFAPPLT